MKWTTQSCSFNLTGSISGATYVNGFITTLSLPVKSSAAQSNLMVSNFRLLDGATSCIIGFIGANGGKFSLSTVFTVAAKVAAQNPIWTDAT